MQNILQIRLPVLECRSYQTKQFDAASKGLKRFFKVWHRRAGKDLSDFNFIVWNAAQRKGLYWHMLPQYNQARKAIWQGMTKDGKRFIDYIPQELVKSKNDQEMKVELNNGSIIQIVGSDNIDSLVGTNPIGIIFSEYALTNPRAWPLIEPILLENGGWAVFNTTPRGKNHAYDLYERAKKSDKWFTQLLTIDDTGIIPQSYIDELREMGTPDEIIQQEYYCSFEGSMVGAYYADQIKWLESNGRITKIPYACEFVVDTYWDIGISDYTTMWFSQKIGQEFRLIDYYQRNGQGIEHYARELESRGYVFGTHYLPHDAGHRQIATGITLVEQLENILPSHNFEVLPRTNSVQVDIMACRGFIRRCVFDEEKCEQGLQALKSYTKKWSDSKQMYEDKPLHDWASHGADAFRYFAINNADQWDLANLHSNTYERPSNNNIEVINDYSPSDYI
jgi:phage terminase large subunit